MCTQLLAGAVPAMGKILLEIIDKIQSFYYDPV